MRDTPHQPTQANHEPSEARPDSCTCCGGAREPDPTDDYMRMLRRLAEIGIARAERLHRQSEDEAKLRRVEPAAAPDADAPDLPKPDPSKHDLALHRIARMVRQCMLLSLRFHKERLEREKQAAADYAAAETTRRARRKRQIERVVRQAIDREAAEHEDRCEEGDEDEDDELDVYGLQRVLSARLDEEDIERDLDRCPQGELVGRLCRDLGIKPAWDFWSQDNWALEEARLKPPGSPYAAPPAPDPEKPEPEEAKPPEPEPEEPKPPEAEAEEPQPEAPVAAPIRNIDRMRTPEYQRAVEEHKARILAKYYNGL